MIMTQIHKVSDNKGSDKEYIDFVARKVGQSPIRQAIFKAICSGKKKEKRISEIESITGFPRKRILEEAIKFHSADVLIKTKEGRDPAYAKDSFLCLNTKEILDLANNPQKREKYVTKRNPKSQAKTVVRVEQFKKLASYKRVYIEDIDSFSKVKSLGSLAYQNHSENEVKNLIRKILRVKGVYQDWGGEYYDLYAYVKINGKKLPVVFALKGKGTPGKLTISKMGKNGDQILRLFQSPAEVFFVQHIGQIDESIINLMEQLAIAKSYALNKKIFFGIIDGDDTSKLFKAYSKK